MMTEHGTTKKIVMFWSQITLHGVLCDLINCVILVRPGVRLRQGENLLNASNKPPRSALGPYLYTTQSCDAEDTTVCSLIVW